MANNEDDLNGQYHYEKIRRWLKADARQQLFSDAISFINYEQVPGDILEFGTGMGKSLALLRMEFDDNINYWRYSDPVTLERQFAGFDSFTGLPGFEERHPRWKTGQFSRNYDFNHPFMSYDEPFNTEDVRKLFRYARLGEPQLEAGWFADRLPETIPGIYKRAAVVHIDCDLYEPALLVLNAVAPILQEGSFLLLDDYFCYKGNPAHGEARALAEFLENSYWKAVHYRTYSTFGNAFIVHSH